MTSQQKKGFEYIISVADGYGRTLPVKTIATGRAYNFNDYNRFYKDIRENIYPTWDGWNILFDIIKLLDNEAIAFGMSWGDLDLKRSVFRQYKEIWETILIKNDKNLFPSEYNIDIQMFDAYLLSENCFKTVCNAINNGINFDTEEAGKKCYNDVSKYNNFIKSAKIAFIQHISLPEWNTEYNSNNIKKDRWYERINVISQL